jgi:hypothetical protein
MSRKHLTAARKAVRTKGKTGLKAAGIRAAMTRVQSQVKGSRGKVRVALLARVKGYQAQIADLS